MRRTGLPRRLGAAVALTALAVTAVPATAASAGPKRGCVVLNNLTEKVINATYTDVAPPGYTVGDQGGWTNQLIKRDGTVIADAVGGSLVLHASGGQLWASMQNTDTFADGVVLSAGLMNVTELLAGEWVSVQATGIGGRYDGKVGTRQFKRIDEVYYDARVILC